MKHLLFAVLLFFCSHPILAQQYVLKGTVHNTDDNTPPPDGPGLLLNADATTASETFSLSDGSCGFDDIGDGDYVLGLQYLGYERTDEPVVITTTVDLGTSYFHENA